MTDITLLPYKISLFVLVLVFCILVLALPSEMDDDHSAPTTETQYFTISQFHTQSSTIAQEKKRVKSLYAFRNGLRMPPVDKYS